MVCIGSSEGLNGRAGQGYRHAAAGLLLPTTYRTHAAGTRAIACIPEPT